MKLFDNINFSGKNFFFAFIKYFSLLIGFTVVMIILTWVFRELSYDSFWKNRDRIYRIALEQYQETDLQFTNAANYRGVSDLLKEELPEVKDRVRLHRDRITVFTPDAQIQDVSMFYADTTIFNVLHRRILARESDRLFPGLRSVVISESLALKIFGNHNPIGKEIRLNEGWTFYVSAVFEDIPENSHINFDLLMTVPSLRYYMSHFNNVTRELEEDPSFEYTDPGPYDNRSWGRWYGYSYILVSEGTNIDKLEEKAKNLIKVENLPARFRSTKINLVFQPIDSIHLHSSMGEEIRPNGSMKKVTAMILVALIVVVISIVNFINISGLDFYSKSSSTAIRMIHGATARTILKNKFINELSISVLSGITAILLSVFIFRQLYGNINADINSIIVMFLLVLFSAVMTLPVAVYILGASNTVDLLKKQVIKNNYGKISRKISVFVQFAIALILISGTIVLFFQMKYIQEKDPGFVSEYVVYSYTPMTMNQSPHLKEKLMVFRNKTEELPGVISFCTSSSVPGKDFLMHSENVRMENDDPGQKSYFNILNMDYNYIETYKLRIISGRNFRKDEVFPDDEVILNRTAAEQLGFRDPLKAPGEILEVDNEKYEIAAVVEDFHHLSLKEQLTPVLMFKSLKWRYAVGYYSFKISGADISRTLEQIGESWSDIYPGEKFLYKFMDQDYENLYKSERNYTLSVTAGSIIAIFIACLGLLSFARYNSYQRIKEIGIRKVFGASKNNILWQFNLEIISIILPAALISLPVSYYLSKSWLSNYAYRIELKWWMFLIAFITLLIIALGTTFYYSLRSSRRNPVDSLRYE